MSVLLIIPLLALCAVQSFAASTFSPARPPAIPLAVRSPYLNTWLSVGSDGTALGNLAGNWPMFWNGAITGWAGQIRVDGEVYTWMGIPGAPSVNQTAFEYTATTSTFVMDVAGAVSMNITFQSPLFPNDYKRQSLVFSYMNVAVYSLDGAEHDVQLYSDATGEWAAGDRDATVQWEYDTTGANSTLSKKSVDSVFAGTGRLPMKRQSPNATATTNATSTATATSTPTSTFPAGGIAYHKFWRQTQLAFSEVADQTEFGYWYWATDNVANLTYQSGSDVEVRGQFQTYGFLDDTQDTDYRAIDDDYPTFGFAIDLGSVSTTPVDTLFSIGLTQENAIQFDGAQGNVSVPSLWTAYFDDEVSALSFFHGDYGYASSKCDDFDSKLLTDATAAGGNDYYIITALAARQAFGATQLCGTLNQTFMFLKEISSDGNVNTVDVIFPMHPILTYTNPALIKLILDPLYINQEAGHWPDTYAIHDIGTSYPNATGHEDGNAEDQPLEECGNMIIMTLAYAQRTGDNAYLSQHYPILTQWVGYLIQEALIPASQISTDDFAGALANQTNLALKGIIGIEAMSKIANLTGHTADASNYTNIAHDYIQKWRNLGIANNNTMPNTTTGLLPHTELSYGNISSWGLLYNLWADAELATDLVPQSIYTMQSTFYPSVMDTYGVPLDTRHTYTKLDWQLFCAAIADESTQQMFFSDIVDWINNTPTDLPLTDLYDAISGDYPGITFAARPVVGGAFALLAIQDKTEGKIV